MNPSRGLCPRCTVQQEEQLLLHYPEDLISPFLLFSKADLLFLTRSGITSILLFILFSLPPIPLPILICSLLYFSALLRPDLLFTLLFLNFHQPFPISFACLSESDVMQWHANSSLYFYNVCYILCLVFSIRLDAKLNGGMRLYLCILPPPAIITSGAHLLYPSTYNTTYYTYQHATPAVKRRYQEDFTYT